MLSQIPAQHKDGKMRTNHHPDRYLIGASEIKLFRNQKTISLSLDGEEMFSFEALSEDFDSLTMSFSGYVCELKPIAVYCSSVPHAIEDSKKTAIEP